MTVKTCYNWFVGIVAFIVAPAIGMAVAPEAHANPRPQYIANTLSVAYWHPVDQFLDAGYLVTMTVKCRTSDRVNYRCRYYLTEKNEAKLVLVFKGVVRKGNKPTRIKRFLDGNVHLTNSRYISMVPLDIN